MQAVLYGFRSVFGGCVGFLPLGVGNRQAVSGRLFPLLGGSASVPFFPMWNKRVTCGRLLLAWHLGKSCLRLYSACAFQAGLSVRWRLSSRFGSAWVSACCGVGRQVVPFRAASWCFYMVSALLLAGALSLKCVPGRFRKRAFAGGSCSFLSGALTLQCRAYSALALRLAI